MASAARQCRSRESAKGGLCLVGRVVVLRRERATPHSHSHKRNVALEKNTSSLPHTTHPRTRSPCRACQVRGGEREAATAGRAQMQCISISQDTPPPPSRRPLFPAHATRFNDGEPGPTRCEEVWPRMAPCTCRPHAQLHAPTARLASSPTLTLPKPHLLTPKPQPSSWPRSRPSPGPPTHPWTRLSKQPPRPAPPPPPPASPTSAPARPTTCTPTRGTPRARPTSSVIMEGRRGRCRRVLRGWFSTRPPSIATGPTTTSVRPGEEVFVGL